MSGLTLARNNRVAAAAIGIALVLSGCTTTEHSEAGCERQMAQARERVEDTAPDRADRVADTLEGALDVQVDGRVDEQLVSRALGEARELERDLSQAFEAGCG